MADMFPMGFVDPIADAFERILNADGNTFNVVRRPMTQSDKSRTIAVFPVDWSANSDDKLIGTGNREPYQSLYRVRIESSYVSGDSEEGRRQFSIDAKSIRAILYRDTTFHVALTSLAEVFMGSTETVIKYDVLKQEFMAGKTNVGFQYLAVTELSITTEIRP